MCLCNRLWVSKPRLTKVAVTVCVGAALQEETRTGFPNLVCPRKPPQGVARGALGALARILTLPPLHSPALCFCNSAHDTSALENWLS